MSFFFDSVSINKMTTQEEPMKLHKVNVDTADITSTTEHNHTMAMGDHTMAMGDHTMAMGDHKRKHSERSRSPINRAQVKDLFSKLDTSSKTKKMPKEVIAMARQLCAQFLGGAWRHLTDENFHFKPITGGMSNLLFLCGLPKSVSPEQKEPSAVLLRIQCSTDMDSILNESIVFTVLSERNMGPKIFGVFPGGRLEEYIPARCLYCRELSLTSVAGVVGRLMARSHCLNVPINKHASLCTVADNWLHRLRDKPSLAAGKSIEMKMTKAQVEMKSKKIPSKVTFDLLEKEMAVMRHCVEISKSPIVFCHNDLQEGNILLHEKCELTAAGEISWSHMDQAKEPLYLIDFEYAGYNYRGFDFANHFCEYILDYENDEAPCYKIHHEQAASDAQKRHFFDHYLDEMDKMEHHGHANESDRDAQLTILMTESRRFMATSHLFWAIWAFLQAEESPVAFGYTEYGMDRLALYFDCKEDMLELEKV